MYLAFSRRFLTTLFSVVLLLPIGSTVHAQFTHPGGGGTTSGGNGGGVGNSNASGGFYSYSASSGLKMNINLWGFVRAPGRYEVPSSTTLLQLISLAGGPTDRARLSDVTVIHNMKVDSTLPGPVVIYNLEEFFRSGDTSIIHPLVDDDTIVVHGDALNVFEEVLAIFRDIALVVSTVIALILAFKH